MNTEVAGLGRAKAEGPLKLAVPRGALFGEALDALDEAGIGPLSCAETPVR